MYQNNIFFYFLKIIFDISALKWSKNTKKILIWSKEKNKKNSNFFKSVFETQKQMVILSDIIVSSNKAHNSGIFVFRISKEKCDPRHVILIKLNSPNWPLKL
jgi:hypothetical protein